MRPQCTYISPILYTSLLLSYTLRSAHGPTRGVAKTKRYSAVATALRFTEDGDIRREIYHLHTDTRSSLNAIERACIYVYIIICTRTSLLRVSGYGGGIHGMRPRPLAGCIPSDHKGRGSTRALRATVMPLHNSRLPVRRAKILGYRSAAAFLGFRARISSQPQQCLCMYTRKPVVPRAKIDYGHHYKGVFCRYVYTVRDPLKCTLYVLYILVEVSFCVCVCTAERKLMIFRDHAHRSAHDYYNIIIPIVLTRHPRGRGCRYRHRIAGQMCTNATILNMCAALQIGTYLDKSVFIEPFASFVDAHPLLVRVEAVLEIFFIMT